MSLQTDSLEVAVLSGGLDPQDPVNALDPLVTQADGYGTAGAVVGQVRAALRADPYTRTIWIVPAAFVATGGVDVTVNDGTPVATSFNITSAAPADLAELVTDWAAALNANASFAAKWSAQAARFATGGTTADAVKIVGKVGASLYGLGLPTYGITVARTSGALAVTVYREPSTCRIDLFGRSQAEPRTVEQVAFRFTQSAAWLRLAAPTTSGAATYTLDAGGLLAPVDLRGIRAVRAEVSALTYPAADSAGTGCTFAAAVTVCVARTVL